MLQRGWLVLVVLIAVSSNLAAKTIFFGPTPYLTPLTLRSICRALAARSGWRISRMGS